MSAKAATRDDTRDDTGDEILRALRRIMRRVTLHSKQLAKQTGLTVPQVLCLRALEQLPDKPATHVELSRALQLTSPTITGIVDRLERTGLVQRERSTSDRRKIGITLTEAGRAQLANVPTPLQEKFLARLGKLNATERAKLLESLHCIVDLMEAEGIDAAPILLPDAHVKSP